METIKPFLSSFSKLKKLSIDALNRDEQKMDPELFDSLMMASPRLLSLHLTGFSLPENVFGRMNHHWKYLQSLILKSTFSMIVTESMLEQELVPFLENHRNLRNLNLTCQSRIFYNNLKDLHSFEL